MALPSTVTFKIADISKGDNAVVYCLEIDDSTPTLDDMRFRFVQDATATEAGIAVHPYGAIIMPTGESAETEYVPTLEIGGSTYYTSDSIDTSSVAVGDSLVYTSSDSGELG